MVPPARSTRVGADDSIIIGGINFSFYFVLPTLSYRWSCIVMSSIAIRISALGRSPLRVRFAPPWMRLLEVNPSLKRVRQFLQLFGGGLLELLEPFGIYLFDF